MAADLIRDPLDPTEAIHVPTGRMAAKFYLGKVDDPAAPTMREIKAMTFIGHLAPADWNQ